MADAPDRDRRYLLGAVRLEDDIVTVRVLMHRLRRLIDDLERSGWEPAEYADLTEARARLDDVLGNLARQATLLGDGDIASKEGTE